MITRDNNCRRLLLAVLTVTSESRFLSPDLLRRSVSVFQTRLGTVDNRAQRISDHNRCLTLVITTATGHGHGYHHQQSHSFGGTTASNFLFPPNVDFHTGQQQQFLHSYPSQLRGHIILVYFCPLARLPIPIFHPTTTALSYLVWVISVEPHRVRGLIAERNCGVLWGRKGHLQLLVG
jgi:hypothetical protein